MNSELILGDEVEGWLTEKPVEWAQVIVMRAALRILPHALNSRIKREWLDVHALSLLRASVIIWILRGTSSYDEKREGRVFGSRAAADAAFVARAAARSADKAFDKVSLAADSIANATDASRADGHTEFATRAAAAAISEASQFEFVSQSVNLDCEWMVANTTPAREKSEHLPDRLNKQPIWLGSSTTHENEARIRDQTQNFAPDSFNEEWQKAKSGLLSLDESFEVWCHWYESVVAGNSFAFSSLSKVEKSVKIRLLEADEDFWNQGFATVNNSVRQWIDEVSLEFELEQFVLKLEKNHKFKFGSDPERKSRKSLSDYLEALAETGGQDRGLIGHNMPPQSVDSQIDGLLPSLIRSESKSAATSLSEPNPSVTSIIERVALISRGLQKLGTMGGLAADKFAEAFGTSLGLSAGVAIVSLVTLASAGLLERLLAWLHNIF